MGGEYVPGPGVAGNGQDVDGIAAGTATPPPPPAPVAAGSAVEAIDTPPVAPYSPPPAYAPVFQPAPARRRGRGRAALAIGLVLVFILAVLGAGAAYANLSLSTTYSPQRAVSDYFTAQVRGNAAAMMDNATFLKGDGAVERYFDLGAVKAMLSLEPNRQLTNVKVVGTQRVDDVTSNVTVSLVWAGSPRTHTYTVRSDPLRVHDLFYHSWRVDIPFVSIHFTMPKQPGVLRVDNMNAPPGATSVMAIEGYHTVSMGATDLYDEASVVIAAFDGDVSTTFDGKLSSLAVASAKASVKRTFALCPAQGNCLGHTYYVPQKAGYISSVYWSKLPGYREIDAYKSWKWSLSGDPTTAMVLVVTNDPGIVNASGTCNQTLTVDGSKTYRFKGTWTATLTWGSSGFVSDLVYDCVTARA